MLPNETGNGGNILFVGPSSSVSAGQYAGIISTPAFGSGGNQFNASSGSGDEIGFEDLGPDI